MITAVRNGSGNLELIAWNIRGTEGRNLKIVASTPVIINSDTRLFTPSASHTGIGSRPPKNLSKLARMVLITSETRSRNPSHNIAPVRGPGGRGPSNGLEALGSGF